MSASWCWESIQIDSITPARPLPYILPQQKRWLRSSVFYFSKKPRSYQKTYDRSPGRWTFGPVRIHISFKAQVRVRIEPMPFPGDLFRLRIKRRTPNVIEPELCNIVEMADNRTLEELLQAPTEGELCVKHRVNILALQETKMENKERSSTVSDYFVIVRGVWLKTNIDILLVAVYAPHDRREKRMLWDYLSMVVNNWEGEVIMMGDFNEVRLQSDRFGSFFTLETPRLLIPSF
nr:RNA-directed DNA polymerase, eukaryota [Tanacetum cinerariifolium]